MLHFKIFLTNLELSGVVLGEGVDRPRGPPRVVPGSEPRGVPCGVPRGIRLGVPWGLIHKIFYISISYHKFLTIREKWMINTSINLLLTFLQL